MDFKSPDLVLLVLFLFSIILFPVLNIRIVSAAQALDPTSVNITKSLSTNNLSKSTSIVILLKINKQGNGLVKHVTITDVVPPMFTGEPKELFKDNVLQKHLAILNDSDFFSYSVSLKSNFDLSKDWIFALPSAKVTYKVDNSTETNLSSSNSPILRLISQQDKDWKIDLWPLYVVILLLISIGSGSAGGVINYALKYRSGSRSIVSKRDIKKPGYVLEVEYSNYIEMGDTCNIKVASFLDGSPSPSPSPQIECYIMVKHEEEFSFPIIVGQDAQHKEVQDQEYSINDKDAHLIIKDAATTIDDIRINVTKRSLAKDIGAGAAAGFITLLALVTTTTAVSGNASWVSLDTYPQNVQSMVTLLVTCFIAGLVPFQILDKATGQLIDTIKITKEQVKSEGLRVAQAENTIKKIAYFAFTESDSINKQLLTLPNAELREFVQDARMRAEVLTKFLSQYI